MRKTKVPLIVFFIISLILGGFMPSYAFEEFEQDKKEKKSEQKTDIPPDTPENFAKRYERFITGKENKVLKKILKGLKKGEATQAELDAFIKDFWQKRDSNPLTPKNERKELIDRRINHIASEVFFTSSQVPGLTFAANEGYRGDMAHVYLLHGAPSVMGNLSGQYFVDLMLWVYVDQDRGDILYAFLFYKRHVGSFKLFPQDQYKIDHCGAVNEVMTNRNLNYVRSGQGCPSEVMLTYYQIQNASSQGSAMLSGRVFAWSLVNFSDDGSIMQGKALQPPTPFAQSVRSSGSRVVGEARNLTGLEGKDFILAKCSHCNSYIYLEDVELADSGFKVVVKRGNIDWQLAGFKASAILKASFVLENIKTGQVVTYEKWATIRGVKQLVTGKPDENISITFLNPKDLETLPVGEYRVSIHISNLLKNKYAAPERKFVKK